MAREIRYAPDGRLDEVVFANASLVHLEDMGDHWCLIINDGNKTLNLSLAHPTGRRNFALVVEDEIGCEVKK